MLFIISSPVSLFYIVSYLVSLIYSLSTTNFFSFWLIIEFSSLLFISLVLFSARQYSYTSVMVFYLAQSSSSLGLLFSYTISSSVFFSSFFFLFFLSINIGLFPFNFWYFYSVMGFPPLPLFLSLTTHNLFSAFIFYYYLPYQHFETVAVILILTLLTSSSLVAISSSLLSVIVVSSLFNNVWILLATSTSFFLFLAYFIVYSFLSFFLIYYPNSSYSTPLFFSLMGFPPLPLFFTNILVLYSLLLSGVGMLLPFLLLLCNVALITLYFNYSSFHVNSVFLTSLRIN